MSVGSEGFINPMPSRARASLALSWAVTRISRVLPPCPMSPYTLQVLPRDIPAVDHMSDVIRCGLAFGWAVGRRAESSLSERAEMRSACVSESERRNRNLSIIGERERAQRGRGGWPGAAGARARAPEIVPCSKISCSFTSRYMHSYVHRSTIDAPRAVVRKAMGSKAIAPGSRSGS